MVIAERNTFNAMCGLWFLVDTPVQDVEVPKIIRQLLAFLNEHLMMDRVIVVLGAFAVAISAIAGLTGNLDKICVFAKKYPFCRKPEITEAQRLKVREDLIEILLKQVVKRLEDSLHHKIRIDLRREEQQRRVGQGHLAPFPVEGTNRTSDNFIKRAFQRFTESTPPISVSAHKSTQFLFEQEDIQGRLLILGEPGSGKTNELLVLTRDLLTRAQQSPELPLPVIFELSEWNSDQAFADWLGQQLLDKYNISAVVSQHWIRHQQLLPLLDGLDEIRRVDGQKEVTSAVLDQRRKAKQIQCVRDINAFLDMFSSPLVVCCRRQEYEAIEAEEEYLKRLQGAIYLQPLENEQIRDYLQNSNRDSLLDSLQSQPELLELAHSPLFLLILIVAYEEENLSGMEQSISSKEELLDKYIYKQLHDLNNQGVYPPGKAPIPEKTHHYLSWLATKLESEEKTEFLIEKLQPSWFDTPQSLKLYRCIFGLCVGLIYGLSFGLIYGLSFGLIYGLRFGLIYGLSFGLIYGLNRGRIYGLSGDLIDIKVSEQLSFSWNSFLRRGLSGGLIFGLSFGLSVGLIYGQMYGLIGGLSGGLSGGLIYGLIGGIETYKVDVRDKIPNQGIRDSIRNGLIVGLSLGLIVGLIYGLIYELIYGLIGGLSIGLIVGLDTGFQHFALRLVLFQSGVSPWNYSRFLDHAENHRFIQRTGGRYRFVHDLLRKRFAATYQEH